MEKTGGGLTHTQNGIHFLSTCVVIDYRTRTDNQSVYQPNVTKSLMP